MPLFNLNKDCLAVRFTELTGLMVAHRTNAVSQLQKMGYVVPTEAFFQREELRYTSIFDHSNKAQALAAAREVLQNSSDAGTDRLDVFSVVLEEQLWQFELDTGAIDVHPCEKNLEELNAGHEFIGFSDTGVWCPEDQYQTFEVCTNYFLKMNGSSKDGVSGDGGFGVGRFVILFCAPLWFFTARHMLVMGHYNCFKIMCRRCLSLLDGPQCDKCGLHERDTPRGTTILANYSDLNGFLSSQDYLIRARDEYYRFCRTTFPIFVAGQQVQPVTVCKTIAREEWFVCCQFDLDHANACYMVRTSAGVLMFSKRIWNSNSAPGYFVVELDAKVNFKMFDQARQGLIKQPGEALRKFLSARDGDHGSNDMDKDHKVCVTGLSMLKSLSLRSQAENKSSAAPRLVLAGENKLRAVPAVAEVPVQVGPVECKYFFRGGKTMDNIDAIWKPGRHVQQVYLLLGWTLALDEAHDALKLKKPDFEVGFVFDADTLAMKEGNTYYINPELMMEEIGNFSKINRFKTMGYLIARAVHEVSHVLYHNHDAGFASVMTDGMSQTLMMELSGSKSALSTKDMKIRSIARRVYGKYQSGRSKARRKTKSSKPKRRKTNPGIKPGKVEVDDSESETESDSDELQAGEPTGAPTARQIVNLVSSESESIGDSEPSEDPDVVRLAMSHKKKHGVKRLRE